MRSFALALSLAMTACGVDVAQTATLDTSLALAPDCSCGRAMPALPAGSAFRAGDALEPSSLVLASYGAAPGPAFICSLATDFGCI